MGYAVSWFAVYGKAPEQVLTELGLAPTGDVEEIPESPVSCASLPGGWFLVFINSADFPPWLSDEALSAVSAGCRVVGCQVEEHVMFSAATCLSDGRRIWHVAHDAQQGMYHLETQGDAPPELDGIVRAKKQAQDQERGDGADADHIHDIPVELARAITGFRHDEDVDWADAEPFQVLEHASTASRPRRTARSAPPVESGRPWWRFW